MAQGPGFIEQKTATLLKPGAEQEGPSLADTQKTPETPDYNDEDEDNDGDGISKPLSNPNKEPGAQPKENTDGLPFNIEELKVMKPESVYNISESVTSRRFNNIGFPLSYGSADLQGFKYKDTVCLNPVNVDDLSQVNDVVLKKNFCMRHFRFQAVVESTGLDGCDGILGLSPRDFGKHSLLADLKREGLIDRTIVSFSNAFHNTTFKAKYHMDLESYMVFGGYNES